MKNFLFACVLFLAGTILTTGVSHAKDLVVKVPGQIISSTVYVNGAGIITSVEYECDTSVDVVCYTYIEEGGGQIAFGGRPVCNIRCNNGPIIRGFITSPISPKSNVIQVQ